MVGWATTAWEMSRSPQTTALIAFRSVSSIVSQTWLYQNLCVPTTCVVFVVSAAASTPVAAAASTYFWADGLPGWRHTTKRQQLFSFFRRPTTPTQELHHQHRMQTLKTKTHITQMMRRKQRKSILPAQLKWKNERIRGVLASEMPHRSRPQQHIGIPPKACGL